MRHIFFLFTLLLSTSLLAQDTPTDWYHRDMGDGFNGISLNKTYKELLQGKSSEPVIVAIIDSGVDTEHEDLASVMWVNEDEIPGNGIDDDKNGYIDDIHGWNFIGGSDGQNVGADTYEVTRLYGKYHYKYKDANPLLLNDSQKKEYAAYMKYKEEVESKRTNASEKLANLDTQEEQIIGSIKAAEKLMMDQSISIESLDSLDLSSNPEAEYGYGILKRVKAKGELESITGLIEEVKESIDGGRDYYNNQLEYAYNHEFNPRTMVGDDYSDPNDTDYGNNDYEGPDALHGTHVAGIVAAARNNGIGMDGVADNVLIMTVRAVPDGDERDKDVANAIRYAVDNGASIINMSFGKGFSWDKNTVDKAVHYAQQKDVLLVHAAGNSAQNNDTTDNFPNDKFDKKQGKFLRKKKEAKNWLEVGALSHKTGEESVASFSNYGAANVDVFAPGQQIYATLPDNEYRYLQGTSMASPVVAGVAAILRSYFPSLKAEQVRQIIMDSATKPDLQVKRPGDKELVPFSSLSASAGMINAYEAVKKASMTKGKKKVKKKKQTKNGNA